MTIDATSVVILRASPMMEHVSAPNLEMVTKMKTCARGETDDAARAVRPSVARSWRDRGGDASSRGGRARRLLLAPRREMEARRKCIRVVVGGEITSRARLDATRRARADGRNEKRSHTPGRSRR